ncbi:flavin reductase family protein [Paraburkholderia sp. BL17N1]|nr:flavin reductase family protein [Paraburkholderia sp. BL17N1]RKR31317.1 flavin reductase (DIM6/NTAB) family NADH-FMN oxidoreductase RutF [Paraburkholderia sp. BL17N1]
MASSSDVTQDAQDAQRAFRSALSMFATGVAVITAPRATGAPIGITVASFNSVSLDPPLILFSVDRRCLSLEDLQQTSTYAVNVLSHHQQHVSNRFSKPNSSKWDGIEFSTGGCDANVLLPEALAIFECEPYAQHDGGDHVIFVGRVVRHVVRSDSEPLIFFGGKYRTLTADDAVCA